MTPAETIRDAWRRVPDRWPLSHYGAPYRVAPRRKVTACAHPVEAPPVPALIEAVEFVVEKGALDGRPWWRIVGRYEGAEVVVAEGPPPRNTD